MKRPAGWRTNEPANGSDICQHRDTYVCESCQVQYRDRLVEVYGAWYWTETDQEKAALLRMLAAPDDVEAYR